VRWPLKVLYKGIYYYYELRDHEQMIFFKFLERWLKILVLGNMIKNLGWIKQYQELLVLDFSVDQTCWYLTTKLNITSASRNFGNFSTICPLSENFENEWITPEITIWRVSTSALYHLLSRAEPGIWMGYRMIYVNINLPVLIECFRVTSSNS